MDWCELVILGAPDSFGLIGSGAATIYFGTLLTDGEDSFSTYHFVCLVVVELGNSHFV